MGILEFINPFNIFCKYIKTPVEVFIYKQFLNYQDKKNKGINNIKELLYKVCIIAIFSSAIVWMSIFMYVAFYYTYMPNVAHIRPVHLQFK